MHGGHVVVVKNIAYRHKIVSSKNKKKMIEK